MKPRVLIVHNAYQHRGGEDAVMEAELSLLRERGHEVEVFSRHNDEIGDASRLALAVGTFWSGNSARAFARRLEAFRPDVVHVHNTFPLISPSIYWVAAKQGVPLVQTLHNFRLLCPQAMFLRDDRVCEDCLGRLPWRGAWRACYRGSRLQSSVLAGMLSAHRLAGTWQRKVTRYIALNDFCRRKFVEGGLPAERIVIKPNFIDAPVPPDTARSGLLFVGRLSTEKGIASLVAAAGVLDGVSIDVAGSGPEGALLEGRPGIRMLGALSGEAVRARMHGATALVLPSIWYENFPRTLVEAFSCGLPVIASRIGALAELVADGETGLLFEPGDSGDLAEKIAWALAHPERMAAMGRNARKSYEAQFGADRNYDQLLEIYRSAIEETRCIRRA